MNIHKKIVILIKETMKPCSKLVILLLKNYENILKVNFLIPPTPSINVNEAIRAVSNLFIFIFFFFAKRFHMYKKHKKHKDATKQKHKKDKKHWNVNKRISDFFPLCYFLSA